jgi:hypothetical protein
MIGGNLKVYIAYCHDRHIDPDIEIFTDKDNAISFAREYMRHHVAYPEDLREEKLEGYDLYIAYAEEEDHAFVVERDVNGATTVTFSGTDQNGRSVSEQVVLM